MRPYVFESGLFMIRARENHENHRHSSASIATTRPNLPASDAPSSRSPGLSPVGASAVSYTHLTLPTKA